MSNPPVFPDDENGNKLRRMYEDGEDLSQKRDIAFTVLLPDSDAVQEFGSYFYNLGLQVKAKRNDSGSGLPWNVVVTVNMLPTYETITDFEQKVEKVVVPLGGRSEGWRYSQV